MSQHRPRLNRAQRRAMGQKADTKFAPADCPQCNAYLDAHGEAIRAACANVGIEHGLLADEALMLWLNGFHDAGHNEEVDPEFRDGEVGPAFN